MDCRELLEIARREKPNVRYARNKNESGIAAFDASVGRFRLVAAKTLLGTWASMPMELLIDGKPAFPDSEWIED
jgi:hypothetical protein